MVATGCAEPINGATVYAQRCAQCYDNASGRMATPEMLRNIEPKNIAAALSNGAMCVQATARATKR
jgi:hypothetical protein